MAGYDIVIVGGAAHGSSAAAHLAAAMPSGSRILVVEKDLTYARSATALSASSIRQQFSQPLNIAVSLYGIAFLRDVAGHLNLPGEAIDVSLREVGYLYLGTERNAPLLRETNVLQRSMGADIALLEREALSTRFPWLATDDLVCGAYGVSGEGWFDGYGLLQALRAKARDGGVEYRAGEVVALRREGDRIVSATLADGEEIACGALLDAAGAAGNRKIAAMAGVPIPVWGKKRCVFQFSAEDALPHFPLLIDTTGAWCRPEGGGYICGISPDDLDESDASDDFEVVWSEFDEIVWPALAARVPAFERIRQGRAWAGHYDMNLLDHNAIVGRLGDLANMYVAAGFSGHGLQQSPAVGRGLAELIVTGRYQTLDLSDFGYERIAAGRPLLEANVI